MPKRRMTAARLLQIATWQKAGANARQRTLPAGIAAVMKPQAQARWAKGARITAPRIMYHGKNIRLYHHTSPSAANKIIKQQRMRTLNGKVSFTTKVGGIAAGDYGKAAVSIKIPYKKTIPIGSAVTLRSMAVDATERYYQVPGKNLIGIKIKRVI